MSLCGEDYAPSIKWYDGQFHFKLDYVNDNIMAVFSPELENLVNIQIYFGTQDYKNSILVAGEGEGNQRKYKDVSYFYEYAPQKYWADGKYRKEYFCDARNMSSNNGEISESEYYYQLASKGGEELENNKIKQAITAKIDTTKYRYGVSYWEGSLIKISYKGNNWTARITEYIMSQDENGYQEYPNFEILI